jgi:hypothetical protein
MIGRYFRDISIMRDGWESTVPLPEADKVVIFRSFMKAGLRFPLDKMLVEVLKTFEIFLHQLRGFYMGYEEPRVRARR